MGKCWVESLLGTSACKGPEVGGSFGCLRREKSRVADVGERGRRRVRGKQECRHGALLQGKDFALSPMKKRMSLSDDSKSSEQNRLAIERGESGRHTGFAEVEVGNGGMVTAQMGAADRGLSHLPWELRANGNFTFLNTPSLKGLPALTQHIRHFLRTPPLLFPLPGVLPPPAQDPFHTDCFFESFRFQLKCHLFRKAHQPHPLKMVPFNNVNNCLLIASPHFVIISLSF